MTGRFCLGILLWWFTAWLGPLAAEEFWYSYVLQGAPVGYSWSRCDYDATSRLYYKKKKKFQRLPGRQDNTSEMSAVLEADFSVRSAYLSGQEEGEEWFCIITVANPITIQQKESVRTLEFQPFYLEVEDFLRYLQAQSLVVGRRYFTTLLSTDRTKLARLSVIYQGEETSRYRGQEVAQLLFQVTTAELNNFWAKARLSQAGQLVSYELGAFTVMQVSQSEALLSTQNRQPLPAPICFGLESVRRMALTVKSDPPDLLRTRRGQKVQGTRVLLAPVIPPVGPIPLNSLAVGQASYLRATENFPSSNPEIARYARLATGRATDAVKAARALVFWTQSQLTDAHSPLLATMTQLVGRAKVSPLELLITLARAAGLPARLASGLVYRPGAFHYESWAELYLQGWIPVLDEQLGCSARVLTVFTDQTWAEYNEPLSLQVTIERIQKKDRWLILADPTSAIERTGERISDWLLGVALTRPKDWALLNKNPWSDLLIFRALTGRGPAILLKVFPAQREGEDFLQRLQKKIMPDLAQTELLWQQERRIAGSKGKEIALRTRGAEAVLLEYRVAMATQAERGILLVLISPPEELVEAYQGFAQLLETLQFLE